jgi:hypothetical protein
MSERFTVAKRSEAGESGTNKQPKRMQLIRWSVSGTISGMSEGKKI